MTSVFISTIKQIHRASDVCIKSENTFHELCGKQAGNNTYSIIAIDLGLRGCVYKSMAMVRAAVLTVF